MPDDDPDCLEDEELDCVDVDGPYHLNDENVLDDLEGLAGDDVDDVWKLPRCFAASVGMSHGQRGDVPRLTPEKRGDVPQKLKSLYISALY